MKFWRKLLSFWWWLKNSVFLSLPFWIIFFASFLLELITIYVVPRMGQNFDDYPGFHQKAGGYKIMSHTVLVLVGTIQSFFFSSILLSAQQKSSIDDKGKHINMTYRVLYYARVAAALCAAPRLPRVPQRRG